MSNPINTNSSTTARHLASSQHNTSATHGMNHTLRPVIGITATNSSSSNQYTNSSSQHNTSATHLINQNLRPLIGTTATNSSSSNQYTNSSADYDRTLASVQKNGLTLQNASAALRANPTIVLAAIEQDAWALNFASDDLQKDQAFLLEAIKKNANAIVHVSTDLNKDFMLKAAKANGYVLEYAHNDWLEDFDVVLAAVQQAGKALMLIPRCAPLTKNSTIVMAAIQQDGLALEHADIEQRADPKIVMAAVKQNGDALNFASAELQKNPDIVMAAVKQNGLALQHAHTDLQKNFDIVKAAVMQNGLALIMAHTVLRNMISNVSLAVKQNGLALTYASDKLKDDSTIVMTAVTQNGLALAFASNRLKADPNIVLAAVTKNGLALEHAENTLKERFNIVLAAVQQDGRALEYAKDTPRNDSQVVLAAVQQQGWALAFASDKLKDDPTIVLTAVQECGHALMYASDKLKDDSTIVMKAVTQNGLALAFTSDRLKADPNIVLAAVTQNGRALEYAKDTPRNDSQIVLAAVQQQGWALAFASYDMRNNLAIVLAAVHQNINAFQYASQNLQQDPTFQSLVHEITKKGAKYWVLSIADIQNNPLKILKKIASFTELPLIQYVDSPGIDAGGLRRDLITRLMQALYDTQNKPLPVADVDGQWIPLMKQRIQGEGYKNLGAFFALVLKYNQATIGTYFHPLFFQMLHALDKQEALGSLQGFNAISSATVDKLFHLYAKESLQFSDADIKAICQGTIPQHLVFTKKEDFFSDDFKETTLACLHIAAGCYQQGAAFDQLKTSSYTLLDSKLQGSLDKEAFYNAIAWVLPQGTDIDKNEDTAAYVIQWLNDALLPDVINLTWAITGSTTLIPGKKLAIGFREESLALPTYHTCFFSMELPNGYPNYPTFKQKLDDSITCALNGQSGVQIN